MHNRFLFLAGLLGFIGVLAGTFGAHGLKAVFDPKDDTPVLQIPAGEAVDPAKVQRALNAPRLTPEQRADGKYRLETYETGVRYHLFHAAALLAVAAIAAQRSCTAVHVAGWAFVVGIIIFPGSLYVLALTGQKWLGMIAPIGGTALMVGWLALLVAGLKAKA